MSMNIATQHRCAAPRVSVPFWTGMFALLNISRQRAALRKLDRAGLADIGVDHSTAMTEANRPIWDVPANWRE